MPFCTVPCMAERERAELSSTERAALATTLLVLVACGSVVACDSGSASSSDGEVSAPTSPALPNEAVLLPPDSWGQVGTVGTLGDGGFGLVALDPGGGSSYTFMTGPAGESGAIVDRDGGWFVESHGRMEIEVPVGVEIDTEELGVARVTCATAAPSSSVRSDLEALMTRPAGAADADSYVAVLGLGDRWGAIVGPSDGPCSFDGAAFAVLEKAVLDATLGPPETP